MAQCDANELFATGRRFTGLTGPQLQILITALLCEILVQSNPMAECNVNDLLNAGKCFNCLTPGQLSIVQTQLLCEILHSGGTGVTCLLCGNGAPTDDAPCDCSIYYSTPPNAGVWVWDSVTSAWECVINPGT